MLACIHGFSQTQSLTLENAEKQFLEKNLNLLAERYNIDEAKAQVIQAGLFDNPNFSFEQNIYNSRNGKYFDFGSQGETGIEVEQLIYLAGKRGKRIRVEKAYTDAASYQFEEILRGLRYALRMNIMTSFYLQKSEGIYDKEISSLQKLVEVYEIQYAKGNVSLIEKSRLKALLFTLQNERTELVKDLINVRKELNILLNNPPETPLSFSLNTSELQIFHFPESGFAEMMTEIANRSDIKMAKSIVQANNADLELQKSMRVPDVNIKGIWDKDGNFIHNYFALGLSFDLPVFNRNQGNIKAAKARVEQSKTLHIQQQNNAFSELYVSYGKAVENLKLYQAMDNSIEKDFDHLIIGVTTSFEQRDISLLEFIDYYETYKETTLQFYNIEKNALLSLEDINYTVGKKIYNILK